MIKMMNDITWENGRGLEELQTWTDVAKPQVGLLQEVVEYLSQEDKILRKNGFQGIDTDKIDQLRSIGYVLEDVFGSIHNALERFMDEMNKAELMRLAEEHARVK